MPSRSHSLTKRPCLSDRATSFPIDSIDNSKLSIIDDDRPIGVGTSPYKQGSLRLIARKRRRSGSRSVSGRSSDREWNSTVLLSRGVCRLWTCSDFPLAVGTDSSGELFGNGDANWTSDGTSLDMEASRDIGGMQSLGMRMSLMRRKKTQGCCFGVTNLEEVLP
ncbi:hypothetical protein GH714_039200 [Hevea brasiliensis]|uniref:Uncharacterized protein n=1 Tax=Hevea brasiliensis TaxID=3981 RepID=A0A6A6MQX3_HEVBR|nr:hypothetical protein GH714_039200 [Hevea brasiliensis]